MSHEDFVWNGPIDNGDIAACKAECLSLAQDLKRWAAETIKAMPTGEAGELEFRADIPDLQDELDDYLEQEQDADGYVSDRYFRCVSEHLSEDHDFHRRIQRLEFGLEAISTHLSGDMGRRDADKSVLIGFLELLKIAKKVDRALLADRLDESRWRGELPPYVGIEAVLRYRIFDYAARLERLGSVVEMWPRTRSRLRLERAQAKRKRHAEHQGEWEELYTKVLRARLGENPTSANLQRLFGVIQYGLATYHLAKSGGEATSQTAVDVQTSKAAATAHDVGREELTPMTVGEMAEAVHCSVGTVQNMRDDAGVEPKKPGDQSPYSLDEVRRILQAGLTRKVGPRCKALLARKLQT